MLVIVITAVLLYLAAGPVVARRALARHKYSVAQLRDCTPDCKSTGWCSEQYKYEYCSCGYRNLKLWKFYWYASPAWPIFLLVMGGREFVTGGEYEPREVKAARRAAELEKVRVEFEERTRALERAAGIRSD